VLYVGHGQAFTVKKGQRFLMVKIYDEGGCRIEFEKRRYDVSSCPWLDGFTDHQRDVLVAILAVGALQTPRTVKGVYRHPGQGFSVVVPDKATGLLEGDPHTERGVRIALPSGGSIFVYGEANSLEWPTPDDGIRWAMRLEPECSSQGIRDARVGKLAGSGTRLSCGDKAIRLLLVFRPGGGPIYWLRLETETAHEAEDANFLERVASSFRIIRWQ
jgi:hypothetical protein